MRATLLVCLAVCLTSIDAPAQTSTGGSIRGYVKDEQEAVLRGARLTATSPDAPTPLTAVTDDAGYYRLLDLPPGTYTVRAELDGFTTWVRDGVAVRGGVNLSVPIVMTIGSRTEVVEIRGETPLLESRSAAQGINISGDLQRAVPLSGRRHFADALLLVPGSASQETVNNTQAFWVHGADLGSNTFSIDGAEATFEPQQWTGLHQPEHGGDPGRRHPYRLGGRLDAARARCGDERHDEGRHESLPRRGQPLESRPELEQQQRARGHGGRKQPDAGRCRARRTDRAGSRVVLRHLPAGRRVDRRQPHGEPDRRGEGDCSRLRAVRLEEPGQPGVREGIAGAGDSSPADRLVPTRSAGQRVRGSRRCRRRCERGRRRQRDGAPAVGLGLHVDHAGVRVLQRPRQHR